MPVVLVPALNANDDELIVAALFVTVGQSVRAGEPLCELESTKANTELEAPAAGFVRAVLAEEGATIKVGAPLFVVTATQEEPLPDMGGASAAASDVEATKGARALADEHGVDLAELGIGGIVRKRDVESFLSGRDPTEQPLPGAVEVVLLGAAGHARAVHDLVRSARPDLWVRGAVDDDPKAPRSVVGAPLLGTSEVLPTLRAEGVPYALLGVGAVTHNALRIELFERLIALGFQVPSLVHRQAAVEPSARMGWGNQIFAGAVVGANVQLGDNTIINSGAVLSHDCRIGSHSHITPGAILAGNVSVGRNTVIGMGVTIYLGVKIGANVMIANGCHIMSDVADGTVVRASQ